MSGEISLLLAGDAMIMRPWSQVRDSDFLGLIDTIRGADVAIANLETVIHEFKGHAQADSGGTYMASPPQIAAELKWAGFDMLAHANNHSFDYGSSGIVETLEHAERAGLLVAGSDKTSSIPGAAIFPMRRRQRGVGGDGRRLRELWQGVSLPARSRALIH